MPLTILGADGSVQRPALTGGDDPVTAFTAELQTAVEGGVGQGAGPAARPARPGCPCFVPQGMRIGTVR